jgi:hypothetical protein
MSYVKIYNLKRQQPITKHFLSFLNAILLTSQSRLLVVTLSYSLDVTKNKKQINSLIRA